jgi:hypothetical protein
MVSVEPTAFLSIIMDKCKKPKRIKDPHLKFNASSYDFYIPSERNMSDDGRSSLLMIMKQTSIQHPGYNYRNKNLHGWSVMISNVKININFCHRYTSPFRYTLFNNGEFVLC